MRIGIFFGGQSREREVSFAGGRTVYDNLDKNLFEAVPIFVDSLGNFILLDWQYLYKGTIRDFYPPIEIVKTKAPASPIQIYLESLGELKPEELDNVITKVGKKITPEQFKSLFDVAFLALHGAYGEDGSLQGLLGWYGIPYTGCGVLPSAIGVNKIAQSEILRGAGFARPKQTTITKEAWFSQSRQEIFEELQASFGLPIVIKSPHQGSSIGVAVLREASQARFEAFVNQSFFVEELPSETWQKKTDREKTAYLQRLTDLREGLGFPLSLTALPNPPSILEGGSSALPTGEHGNSHLQNGGGQEGRLLIYHPEDLRKKLDMLAQAGRTFLLTAESSENEVLVEQYIAGKEFSCIVIENEAGEPVSLPPTEIRKFGDVFDYRGKYLPGMSRKVTPMDEQPETVTRIRQECQRLFRAINASVYARIDGFLTEDGTIFLNDPNTTSGMMPSSFFFHQAAEIGLNASNFLTYIIRTSIVARLREPKKNIYLPFLLKILDKQIAENQASTLPKRRVAVIMGGYSTERHISMESGRNVYEKLASSTKYAPFPVFLMRNLPPTPSILEGETSSNSPLQNGGAGGEVSYSLYVLPIHMMLKDNADDIALELKLTFSEAHKHELQKTIGTQQAYEAPFSEKLWKDLMLEEIRKEFQFITEKYAGKAQEAEMITLKDLKNRADCVFIALHGRPGEDGALQQELEKYGLPYNGSGVSSSQITIDKYKTNEILYQREILVAKHTLVYENEWRANADSVISKIEREFNYPFITKPADDGCSSAVRKIKNREELTAFAEMMFRPTPEFLPTAIETLKLKLNEEFPQKNYFLLEELIEANGAKLFMEITGGMLTHLDSNKGVSYEVFEPSETLSTGDVLSLEEKFLAGEGQNITPAMYSPDATENKRISQIVRTELGRVAKILGVVGYCRIDAFVRVYEDGRVETIIIEVNSLPGMTPATCIFHQCALNGYKPYQFIDEILDFGAKR
jgi:D-alanine-D-alanine ligase